MLSAYSYVYADKFTACVQNVRLPNACMHDALERLLRTCPTFSETVMVSVRVSKLCCTELFIVEPGVKINGAYYRDVLLTQKLLQSLGRYQEMSSCFSRTVLQHTALVRQLSSYVERRDGLYFTRTVATKQSRS